MSLGGRWHHRPVYQEEGKRAVQEIGTSAGRGRCAQQAELLAWRFRMWDGRPAGHAGIFWGHRPQPTLVPLPLLALALATAWGHPCHLGAAGAKSRARHGPGPIAAASGLAGGHRAGSPPPRDGADRLPRRLYQRKAAKEPGLSLGHCTAPVGATVPGRVRPPCPVLGPPWWRVPAPLVMATPRAAGQPGGCPRHPVHVLTVAITP